MRMNSLRSQLLIRSLLLLLAILLGVGVVQYLFMERFLYRNKADAIRRQIMSVPGDAWQRFSEGMRRGREFPVFILSSSSVIYRDPNGNLTEFGPDADETAAPKLNQELLKETLASPDRDGGRISYRISDNERGVEQLVVMQAVRSFGGMGGIVQVSTNTGPIKADAYRQLALYSGIAVLALLLGWLLFRPVIKRTLIPLHRVTRTLERIDAGSLGERLPSKQGQAEIDLLAASTNRMLERLEQSFRSEQEGKERMRRFVADASHELRTPLTSIHGFLEILLRGAASHPEQLEQALRSMHGESKRMGKLVHDLLLLAKLDRNPELHPDETDLNGILREMEPHLRLLAADRQVIFELQTLPSAKLDTDKIKQVLLNLFQNAVQHTDPVHGEIRITTELAAGGIAWSVGDNGSGIPAGHLPRLFDRFYRVDESRARAYGGAGLGLSISKAIVEWHGGTLSARSELGRGSRFTVLLPVAEPDG